MEIVGWIESSAVDALWTVKLQVNVSSDLTLAITRGQGGVVETLANGEHSITLGDATLATFSSRPPDETDATTWDEPVLRVHGSPATSDEARDCAQCHEAQEMLEGGALEFRTSLPDVSHLIWDRA